MVSSILNLKKAVQNQTAKEPEGTLSTRSAEPTLSGLDEKHWMLHLTMVKIPTTASLIIFLQGLFLKERQDKNEYIVYIKRAVLGNRRVPVLALPFYSNNLDALQRKNPVDISDLHIFGYAHEITEALHYVQNPTRRMKMTMQWDEMTTRPINNVVREDSTKAAFDALEWKYMEQ